MFLLRLGYAEPWKGGTRQCDNEDSYLQGA